MKTVLITGGAGFIGSKAVRLFARACLAKMRATLRAPHKARSS